MRIWKIIAVTLVLSLLSIASLNCTSESNPVSASEDQVVLVQRGDLKIDITAIGNLALSRKEDLAFDIFYRRAQVGSKLEATVEEVLVEEGDIVTEGQVLAKLDASEWQEQLDELEDAVTAAERQVALKERELIQKKVDLLNAEIALEDAEAQYVWPAEIFSARDAVWSAERNLEDAQAILRGDKLTYDRQTGQYYYEEAKTPSDIKFWTQKVSDYEETLRARRTALDELLAESAADAKVTDAEAKLWTAQVRLDKLLAASTAETAAERAERNEAIAIQRLKVELAQRKLEDAQQAQEKVAIQRLKVELAQGKLEDAEKALEDAQKTVEDAQEDLDEAKSKSSIITAPFAGFITVVNVEGGDEVLTGTVAVQLADPNKFEAEVMVSEMDIFQVKLGGTASVQVDAMPAINLPAKVTHISPTATIQQGVVNYKVKVEIESLQPIEPGQSTKRRQDPYAALDEAVKAGRITSEQAEQLKERMKEMEEAVRAGRISQEQIEQFKKRLQQRQAEQQRQSVTIPQDFQLREGLTVTVNILVEERKDVLLVPNKAITRQGKETYVQVLKEGVVEERSITTGISDWQYTEVTDGLSEGDKLVLPGTTTGTTSTTPQRGFRMPFFGRGGGSH